jgi:hypothetical protein
MKRSSKHESYSRLWGRPTHLAIFAFAAICFVVGEVLQNKGVAKPYVETGFTLVVLMWALLAAFRPEWRRFRYWFAMLGMAVCHTGLAGLVERRAGHLGFVSMFSLVAVEFAIGATVIMVLIPEDVEVMRDYIRRW